MNEKKSYMEDVKKESDFFNEISKYVESQLKKNNINREVPIVLEEICNKYQLKVEYIDLLQDSKDGTIKNKTIGNLLVYHNENKTYDYANIYIDKNSSYLVKRYALAHEIAHYLLEKEDEKTSMQTFSLLFPGFKNLNKKEILVDYIAILILIPEKFLEKSFNNLMKEKVNESEFDIDLELMALSREAQVPFYVLVQAFQFYRIKNISNN